MNETQLNAATKEANRCLALLREHWPDVEIRVSYKEESGKTILLELGWNDDEEKAVY